jgi:hypothetical protein
MAEHNPTPQPLPDLSIPDLRHEHRDVNVWAVGKVGIALILTTIASLLLMFGVFRYLEVRENAAQIPPPYTTTLNPNRLPPEPNLMFNEHEAINREDIRADEDKLLNGYSWVDQAHGVVRIPIDRAMDLVAQRGLPARPQNTAPSREGKKK